MLPFDLSLVPPHERVLAAVSGGADSLALLLGLVEAGREIVVAHVNHALHELRPGECDADEAFVRARCQELKVPFVSARLNLPRRDKDGESHVNEAVAREARYRELARLAREHACPRVATGHTASDQLETLLLFWMRGATIAGWNGIAPSRELEENILLVRPLLSATKAQTQHACRSAGWSWREDESNRDERFGRNRVRHELLPLLSELSGHNLEQLALQTARMCETARDDAAFLDGAARDALTALVLIRESELLVLDGLKFRALPIAMQRRALRLAARDLSGSYDGNWEAIERARRQVADGGKRVVWQWRGGLSVEWTGAHGGNRIRLKRVGEQAATPSCFSLRRLS